MASNITLTEGMRANLFSLQNTSKLMELTQKRLSTGKRVNTALDDPINFFAAQNHQQRADDLAFRKDAMGEAIQGIKAADNGIDAITNLIASAKSTAQSALSTTSTAERSDLAVQYNAILDQKKILGRSLAERTIGHHGDPFVKTISKRFGSDQLGVQVMPARFGQDRIG